jgi:hypothetical protein
MRRLLPITLAALLAACAADVAPPAQPTTPTTTLPTAHLRGIGDPTRGAILATSPTFSRPARLRGRPADAALAVMALRGFNPLVGLQLAQGRDEVRGLIGIAPGAPPQAVIDAMFAASEALRARDRAAALRALSPEVAPDAARTLAALDAMPATPIAARATTAANTELRLLDQSGGNRRDRRW